MNDGYLLEQLVKVTRAHLKALAEYGAYKAPLSDPIKAAHLDEVRRRREDLKRLMVQIEKVHPVPTE